MPGYLKKKGTTMYKILGRILLIAAAIILGRLLVYFLLSNNPGTLEIVLFGTACMLLVETIFYLEKKLFHKK